MSDTLDKTFEKYFHCEHGKEPGEFCQECHDEGIKQSAENRKKSDEWLAWANFHDNVLNS